MIFEKSVLSSCIKDMKSIATTKTTRKQMNGILFVNGNLIASNNELTIKAKIGGVADEQFIIPAIAFDLINNLPEGQVEISPIVKDTGKTDDKGDEIIHYSIQIKLGTIKNKFQSFDPDTFTYTDKIDGNTGNMTLDYTEFKEAIGKVMYAIADDTSNSIMSSLCIDCHDGYLNMVGLDGHRISWNKVPYSNPLKILIPKNAIKQLLSLDMNGALEIAYGGNHAIFSSDVYEVHTRLTDGSYFSYDKMFTDYEKTVIVNRKEMLDALNRSMLSVQNNVPSKLIFTDKTINISTMDVISQYVEDVNLIKSNCDKMEIGFNTKIFIDALRSFDSDNVTFRFSGPNIPLLVVAEKVDLQALVLPVRIKGSK